MSITCQVCTLLTTLNYFTLDYTSLFHLMLRVQWLAFYDGCLTFYDGSLSIRGKQPTRLCLCIVTFNMTYETTVLYPSGLGTCEWSVYSKGNHRHMNSRWWPHWKQCSGIYSCCVWYILNTLGLCVINFDIATKSNIFELRRNSTSLHIAARFCLVLEPWSVSVELCWLPSAYVEIHTLLMVYILAVLLSLYIYIYTGLINRSFITQHMNWLEPD